MKILNILLIISTLILYGCSKYDIYDWFIESTRNSANLELQDLRINDGKLVYLENKNKNYESNETIILIHGFGANKDSWLYLA